MKQDNKHKAKRRYDPLFSQTIKDAVKKFNVSETYVRLSVNLTEKGGISEDIRRFVKNQLAQYKAITPQN